MSPDEVKRILREEMDSRGWHNNDWRAGLAAIIGGESRFIPKFESGYANTSNARIRKFFGSRVRDLSDDELDRVKSTDVSWFNHVYGSQFSVGRQLGNIDPNDGYRYRGGGLNQLTGRANYAKYGPKVGVDLIAHPELVNTPRVAAAVAVEYMKDRFHGGDFSDMKRAVGVSLGEPDAEKNRLYALYTRIGEWNYRPSNKTPVVDAGEGGDTGVVYDPIVTVFLESLQNVERFLKAQKLYTGPIDHDPGPGLRAALKAYMRSAA